MTLLLLASFAHATPLFTERFDRLSGLFKERIVAPKGGGLVNKPEVANGVMTFVVEARTKRFLSIEQKVELRGLDWLDVSAKVALTGVSNPAPDAVCGLFVRFDTGEVVPARPCADRADTEPHHRWVQVPAGARDAFVGVMLSTPGTLVVDDVVADGTPPDVKTLVRGSFVYHWLGADSFRDDHTDLNDTVWQGALAFLGGKPSRQLAYWKYPDEATLEAFTGRAGPAWVTATDVHSVLKSDARALVLAAAIELGAPGPLLAEGLSIHLAGDWEGRDTRLTTRTQVNEGRATTLATLLTASTFAAEPPERAFPMAGAFVSWVVATKGPEAIRALYSTLKAEGSAAENQAALERALGASLATIEKGFRDSL
jgi:hypothetical protein